MWPSRPSGFAEAQARQLARAERQTETPLPPKEVALAYFTAMSDAVYPAFAEVLGGQKPTIKVRSMVSRWGVCAMAKRQIDLCIAAVQHAARGTNLCGST